MGWVWTFKNNATWCKEPLRSDDPKTNGKQGIFAPNFPDGGAGICGTYREEVISIDPVRLCADTNTITLVHKQAYFLKHVIYDFLRLETAQD